MTEVILISIPAIVIGVILYIVFTPVSKEEAFHYKEHKVFIKDEEIIFFPVVRQSLHRIVYDHIQLMFWIKIKNFGGHYYFTEKTAVDKVLNFVFKDEFELRNYKATVIKKANSQSLKRILKKFGDIKEIEIEVAGNNLFVKTLRQPNADDYHKIKEITASF